MERNKSQMKTIIIRLGLILIFIAIIVIACTYSPTKMITNQYPCDTDSVGLHKQNVNIYIEKPKEKKPDDFYYHNK